MTLFFTAYMLVIAPGCRQREQSYLSGSATKSSRISFKATERYRQLKKDDVHSVVDKALSRAQETFAKQKLTLIRVGPNGQRKIASRGLVEYWDNTFPGQEYYYVDSASEPSIALSVRAKKVSEETVVLELLQHDPETFAIEHYTPLFIELGKRDKKSIVSNVGEFKRSLKAFSAAASARVSERYESQGAISSSPEALKKVIVGMIVATVAGAVGFIIAAALRKQTEGKIQWGLVSGVIIVGIAVYLLVLYSTFVDEEVDEEQSEGKLSDKKLGKLISDRTWKYITLAR